MSSIHYLPSLQQPHKPKNKQNNKTNKQRSNNILKVRHKHKPQQLTNPIKKNQHKQQRDKKTHHNKTITDFISGAVNLFVLDL